MMKKRFLLAMMALIMATTAMAKTDFPFLDAMGLDVTPVVNTAAGEWNYYPSNSVYVNAEKFHKLTVFRNGETILGPDESGYICMARKMEGDITLLAYRVSTSDGYLVVFATYDHEGNLVDGFNAGNWYLFADKTHFDDGSSEGILDNSSGSFTADAHLVITRDALKQRVLNHGSGPVMQIWNLRRVYEYAVSSKGVIMQVGCTSDGMNLNTIGKEAVAEINAADVLNLPKSEKKRIEKFEAMYNASANAEEGVRSKMRAAVAQLFMLDKNAMLTYMYKHPQSNLIILLEESIGENHLDKWELYKAIQDLPEGKMKKDLGKLTAQWGDYNAVG